MASCCLHKDGKDIKYANCASSTLCPSIIPSSTGPIPGYYICSSISVKVSMFCKACSVSLYMSSLSHTSLPSAYLTSFSSVLFSILSFSIWGEYLISEFYPFNFSLIPSLWACLHGTGVMWIFKVKKTSSL